MLCNKVKAKRFLSPPLGGLRSTSVLSDATPQTPPMQMMPHSTMGHHSVSRRVHITSRTHHPRLRQPLLALACGHLDSRSECLQECKESNTAGRWPIQICYLSTVKRWAHRFWTYLETDSRVLIWQRAHKETRFQSPIKIHKGLVKGNGCTLFCHVSSVKGQLCMPLTNSVSPYPSPSTHCPLALTLFTVPVLSLSHPMTNSEANVTWQVF